MRGVRRWRSGVRGGGSSFWVVFRGGCEVLRMDLMFVRLKYWSMQGLTT